MENVSVTRQKVKFVQMYTDTNKISRRCHETIKNTHVRMLCVNFKCVWVIVSDIVEVNNETNISCCIWFVV